LIDKPWSTSTDALLPLHTSVQQPLTKAQAKVTTACGIKPWKGTVPESGFKDRRIEQSIGIAEMRFCRVGE
jgi:hypothetical protein